MVNTNGIDNMDNPDSLYRVLFRNNANYGMCYINNELRRDNMNPNYIDLKYEEFKLCTKVYRELGREKFIKLYEEYIKNEEKATNTTNIGERHDIPSSTANQSQEAKEDKGKPKLTLVPDQILYDIAEVREYGNQKYGDPNSWRTVEIERYRDAAFRHFLSYIREPDGKDEESGIEHLKHLACNIAFLCALEKNKKED